jgi:hypothetical protein
MTLSVSNLNFFLVFLQQMKFEFGSALVIASLASQANAWWGAAHALGKKNALF